MTDEECRRILVVDDEGSIREIIERSLRRAGHEDIVQAEPIYEDIEGFTEETQSKREFDDLPAGAKRFVRRVEALAETPIYLISVGPSRSETIVLRNPFRG